jgi:hypothetical protein
VNNKIVTYFKSKFFENRCFTLEEAELVIIEQVRMITSYSKELKRKENLANKIASSHINNKLNN